MSETKGLVGTVRGKWLVIGGIIIGLALIFLPNFIPEKKEEVKDEYFKVSYYTQFLEDEIENMCLQIKGISKVSVLLTLDCSEEYVYAKNTDGNAMDYVIVENNGHEQAVSLSEIYPKIRGVGVVCNGGDSSEVQQKITDLLSAALGISSAKIRVVGGG